MNFMSFFSFKTINQEYNNKQQYYKKKKKTLNYTNHLTHHSILINLIRTEEKKNIRTTKVLYILKTIQHFQLHYTPEDIKIILTIRNKTATRIIISCFTLTGSPFLLMNHQ